MKNYIQFLESVDSEPIENSEEFWKWFGDSKIVDSDGRPLVVYHGTSEKIDEFHPSDDVVYFSAHKNISDGYGGIVMKAYISIKNPYVFNWKPYQDENGEYWYFEDGEITKRPDVYEERTGDEVDVTYSGVVKDELIRRGFDGAVSDEGWSDRVKGFDEIAVFYPDKQIRIIKSL